MIGWFLAVPGRAHFLVCLIGWLSRAQTLYSWYCVLGYTMPLIAAVLVLVTLDKGLSLLFSIVISISFSIVIIRCSIIMTPIIGIHIVLLFYGV